MAADSYAVSSRTAINAAVLRAGQDVLDADAVADQGAGSPLRTAGSSPQPSSLNLTHDVLALSPGTAVVIHGTSNTSLNGASGRVERFLSSTARYAIALEDGTLVSVCQVTNIQITTNAARGEGRGSSFHLSRSPCIMNSSWATSQLARFAAPRNTRAGCPHNRHN